MSSPKVLIITAAFNCEKYIEETLRSVIAQTHQEWIYVIVDDGSIDQTWTLIEQYSRQDPRIIGHRVSVNSGRPSVPRNLAIEIGRQAAPDSEFLALLDHDDLWLPAKLSNQLKIFKVRPDAGLVYSGLLIHLNEGTRTVVQRRQTRGLRDLCFFSAVTFSSVLLRISAIETDLPKLFDEDPNFLATEDYDCWFRLLQRGVVFARTQQEEVVYRVIGNSASMVGTSRRFRRLMHLYGKAAVRYPDMRISWLLLALALKGLKYLCSVPRRSSTARNHS